MGPLAGIRVIELAGIGPGPFCAMMLADMGADVVRIDRPQPTDLGVHVEPRFNLLNRGRRSVVIDLKNADGIAALKRLIAVADALIEGFRPGVTERIGIGPDECRAINPKLVYGRMTGWGQQGPLASASDHDINYIALTGALHSIGPSGGQPVPPLNIVGDFGGGALFLAFGLACALIEARSSGQGQVVDAAILDGVALLMAGAFGYAAAGTWVHERGHNVLDGGAPWYNVYETSDGQYVSIGSIEARFYAELLRHMGLNPADLPDQHDRAQWPTLHARLADAFKGKTRAEWSRILEGTDACFAPVLSLEEAPLHSHNQARGTFVEVEGIVQPGPAPRFSRTSPEIRSGPAERGQHTTQALSDWGFSGNEIHALRTAGAIE